MKVCLGIDLGSTTTKAVVLDGAGTVVGRGITNSRSDYDVACAVARDEAMVNTRFSMLRAVLGPELPAAELEGALQELERAFRGRQLVAQLASLRDRCLQAAADMREGARRGDLESAVGAVLDEIGRALPELIRSGASRKSDFFRDLAGSLYQRFAEAQSVKLGIDFDSLVSVFDRAILQVENARHDLTLETHGPGTLRDLAPALGRILERHLPRVLGEPIDVVSMVGTGYGRARLPFPKERIRSEILCHGLGAHLMFPATATVLDIGGQDTKAIQVDADGIVTSFQMNDRCAAGCGRYLGYIADEMNLGVHGFAPLAETAKRPVRISSTCTVFAGAELRDRLSLGEHREDILAGLHRAIVLRAVSLLARSGGVKSEFTFTGGVARNSVAVKVLRQLIQENYEIGAVNVSPDSIYTGALGAATFASRDTTTPLTRGIEV